MNLSISNIAWNSRDNEEVYKCMLELGYTGLEIAPTKIVAEAPYSKISEAKEWAVALQKKYAFCIPSMQSIWYGIKERVFGTSEEREFLTAYTKSAIEYASKLGCKNLVFGCPRNREKPENADESVAVDFFREIGNYAYDHGTVIGMEANPPIYNTNYINDTISAIRLIKEVDSKGFRLNLDVGTMIHNKEDISVIADDTKLINHVHISEPNLKPIVDRNLHRELFVLLKEAGYSGFVSIEMGCQEDIVVVRNSMEYVRSIFV